MRINIEQVEAFHRAFGVNVGTTPVLLEHDRALFRQRILEEEVAELAQATADGDIVEIADAITDCLYVLFGTAIEHGIAGILPELFNEVHRSNMSKLDASGRPVMRDDGKVLKSDLFTPPDLKKIIDWYIAVTK